MGLKTQGFAAFLLTSQAVLLGSGGNARQRELKKGVRHSPCPCVAGGRFFFSLCFPEKGAKIERGTGTKGQ